MGKAQLDWQVLVAYDGIWNGPDDLSYCREHASDTVRLTIFPNLSEQRANLLIGGIPTALTVLTWIQDAITTLVHRRRLKRRYVPPEHGYFRVEPYSTPKGEPSYSRPDGAHEDILRWISGASSSLLYLTGRSGCGKSSLVSAWLKPKPEQEDWIVLILRESRDPLQAAASAVSTPGLIWQRPPSSEDPYDQLRKAGARAKEHGRRILVVIDQFEEFMITHEDDDTVIPSQERLTKLGRTCLTGLHILLVFRSDYEHLVYSLGLPTLHQSENWTEIGAYTTHDAIQFMMGGLPGTSEVLLSRLMSGIEDVEGTSGLYRPITLNMAGMILYRDAGSLGQAPERLMHRYVSDAVRTPEIAEYAPRILNKMITDGGRRKPHLSLADLASDVQLEVSTVRQCLYRLSVMNLVRPLDSGRNHWEICHDFLAQLIGNVLARSRPYRLATVRRWLAPMLQAAFLAFLFITTTQGSTTTLPDIDFAKARLSDLGCLLEEYRSFSLAETSDCRGKRLPHQVKLRDITDHITTVLNGSQIRTLDLSSYEFRDIRPLRVFSEIETLRIIIKGKDLDSISSMKELRTLDVSDSEIEDLRALSNLTKLRVLRLQDTRVSDLSGISGLSELHSLDLDGTAIADLRPLTGMSISNLWLSRTRVVDLSPLSQLEQLRNLDLSYTEVTELSPISTLEELEGLILYCVQANLGELTSLPKLTRLLIASDDDVGPSELSEMIVRTSVSCSG